MLETQKTAYMVGAKRNIKGRRTSTRIRDAGIGIRNSRGYFPILQGLQRVGGGRHHWKAHKITENQCFLIENLRTIMTLIGNHSLQVENPGIQGSHLSDVRTNHGILLEAACGSKVVQN